MHAALEHTYADDYLEIREQYRGVHLKAVWEAIERGELLLGGAMAKGPSPDC
ncbi:hypothetical protein ACFRAU_04665 [Arthrobacter sp. NPDC056691]|uniref:hypothetical protein n=1 Tax=Arthrobacter sp. NPDC056691 TaxID=3345913 RepID=UPI00366CD176